MKNLLLGVVCATTSLSYGFLNEDLDSYLFDSMQEAKKALKHARNNIVSMVKENQVVMVKQSDFVVNLDDKGELIVIEFTVASLKDGKSIDATTEDDVMRITIPGIDGTILVTVTSTDVAVRLERVEEKKNEKDEVVAHSSSVSSLRRTLPALVVLNHETQVEYDTTTKKVRISIPKKQEKQIAVTVK